MLTHSTFSSFRLYKLVKPTQVLYLAVDGVAPRAKMNQQRSRRFRSAKEAEQTAAEVLAREGTLPDTAKRFDSNCITPGTDFMLKLSLALQKWVEYKMKTDVFWQQGADVIVSGPDVPGEGEHKVMDFVRECQEQYKDTGSCPYYSPNDTHLLYGLDADLIMLGLVTHEPNFMLLREKMSVVMAGRGRHKHRKKKDMMDYDQNDFEVLELKSLRQLLAIQFRRFADENALQEKYGLNRIIDDFVFMCMLVGNDFLPHTPHLEIDNGAISLMITNYIDLLPEWGGYLTDKAKIHPKRLEQFLYNLAAYEEEHFYRRGLEENEPGWKLSAENEQEDDDFYGTYYGGKPTPAAAVPANKKGAQLPPSVDETMIVNGDSSVETAGNRAFRRRHPNSAARSYRDFYYETKLGWSPKDRNATIFRRRAHVRDYLEGLHWVLNYYHNGCQSWDWYFPYLYSPLCTDMVNLEEFYDESEKGEFKSFHFESGTPFPSLAQLLSVLPPQSAELLPEPLAELMIHPSSPLMTYYPQDFTTDANGKRQSWEAVVQIPFIDADVLLDTVQQIMKADEKADDEKKLLTNAERRRNILGKNHVFVAPHRTGVVEKISDEERVMVEAAAEPSRGRPKRVSGAKRVAPKNKAVVGAPRRGRPPKGSANSK